MAQQTSYTSSGSYSHSFNSDTEKVKVTMHGGDGGNADDNGMGYDISSGDNGSEVTAEFDIADLPSTIEVRVAGDGGTGDGSGGYNGGADGQETGDNLASGGGGGASDIRDDGGGASTRYLVAGGGGGGGGATAVDADDSSGGANSGHTSGDDSYSASTSDASASGAGGGTQSSGGNGYQNGGFGSGGYGEERDFSGGAGCAGGGGSGYYGGGGGFAAYDVSPDHAVATGGGGGSDYFGSNAYNKSRSTSFSSPEVTIEEFVLTSPPTNTSQTVEGDDQITITWTDNEDSEDGYEIEVSEDGGSWSAFDTVGANVESYTATVSTGTDTFRWRVRAYTSTETTAWDYSSTKSTEPSIDSFDNSVEDELTVNWTPSDGADGFDVYRAQSSQTESRSNYTQVASGLSATTTSFTDTGLEDGEKYFYRVDANYTQADSLSPEKSQVTLLPAAGSVALDTGTEDEITVSWSKTDDNDTGEWEVYASTDGTLGSRVADAVALTTTAFTHSSLADGEKYYYTVRRVTDHASADSSQTSGVTVLPEPSGLGVDAINGDDVDLSWVDNSDNEDGFKVHRSRDDGGSWTLDADLAAGTTTHTAANLLDGEQYRFAVEAYTEHASAYAGAEATEF